MIAIDTNVLVRYIVQDHKEQAARASAFIESLSVDSGFISSIVLCELNWVLISAYKIKKEKRIVVLDTILSTSSFKIENLTIAIKALRSYQKGSADFSDYLILETAKQAGYSGVATFDKAALNEESFETPISQIQ